jgi:hypothetical protein
MTANSNTKLSRVGESGFPSVNPFAMININLDRLQQKGIAGVCRRQQVGYVHLRPRI